MAKGRDRILSRGSRTDILPRCRWRCQTTNVNYAVSTVVVHSQATIDSNQLATPSGAHDGVIVAHNAFAEETGRTPRALDHRVIPRTIFTDPQIGILGITDAEANPAGHRCWCNTVPMELVPRAGAIRDTRGMIKMVIDDDSKEVLGVSIVGGN